MKIKILDISIVNISANPPLQKGEVLTIDSALLREHLILKLLRSRAITVYSGSATGRALQVVGGEITVVNVIPPHVNKERISKTFKIAGVPDTKPEELSDTKPEEPSDTKPEEPSDTKLEGVTKTEVDGEFLSEIDALPLSKVEDDRLSKLEEVKPPEVENETIKVDKTESLKVEEESFSEGNEKGPSDLEEAALPELKNIDPSKDTAANKKTSFKKTTGSKKNTKEEIPFD